MSRIISCLHDHNYFLFKEIKKLVLNLFLISHFEDQLIFTKFMHALCILILRPSSYWNCFLWITSISRQNLDFCSEKYYYAPIIHVTRPDMDLILDYFRNFKVYKTKIFPPTQYFSKLRFFIVTKWDVHNYKLFLQLSKKKKKKKNQRKRQSGQKFITYYPSCKTEIICFWVSDKEMLIWLKKKKEKRKRKIKKIINNQSQTKFVTNTRTI